MLDLPVLLADGCPVECIDIKVAILVEDKIRAIHSTKSRPSTRFQHHFLLMLAKSLLLVGNETVLKNSKLALILGCLEAALEVQII